jgi:hypothetical protein
VIDAAAESRDVLPEWIAKLLSNEAPDSYEQWMQHWLPVHYLDDVPPILPLQEEYINHLTRAR